MMVVSPSQCWKRGASQMMLKTTILSAALLAAFGLPALAQSTTPAVTPTMTTATTIQSGNNCAPGERIDGSTATQARSKLEAAGYANVAGLNKGCDNVWHATATSNGNPVNVMLAPDGSVHQETN